MNSIPQHPPEQSPEMELPRYDIRQSYDWNFAHAPTTPPTVAVPPFPGDWTYCGLSVRSPFGIAAGPLLNGNWLTYYAALGFDMLTYKTVRSRVRECYPLPNLQPVATDMLQGPVEEVVSSEEWQGSWGVSFGMPSKSPEFWTQDVRACRTRLQSGQLLSVSVVGTMQPGWSLTDLANDYADCARMAVAAGADCVEMNFSCPNVCSADGQLFQVPTEAGFVAEQVRKVINPATPLLVKIGYLPDDELLSRLLAALAPQVQGIVMTNSLPARVRNIQGELLFNGEDRGICGRATRAASIDQVRRCREICDRSDYNLDLIGVGGIESAADVRRYLDAGANSVQLATAPMYDPLIGVRMREEFPFSERASSR